MKTARTPAIIRSSTRRVLCFRSSSPPRAACSRRNCAFGPLLCPHLKTRIADRGCLESSHRNRWKELAAIRALALSARPCIRHLAFLRVRGLGARNAPITSLVVLLARLRVTSSPQTWQYLPPIALASATLSEDMPLSFALSPEALRNDRPTSGENARIFERRPASEEAAHLHQKCSTRIYH